MAGGRLIQPDMDFIREVKRAGGDTLKKCYQCATCATVCNLSPKDRPFPRKEMILAGWGQSDTLMRDPDVWLCHQCNDCSVYCPREARPGDVLAAIRSYAYKHFAFPSFMGKALASSKALPVLLLVPVIILLTCITLFAPRTDNGGFLFLESSAIDFNNFLPHSAVDGLFVIGNIIIFLFASIGFLKFWRGIQQPGVKPQLSFVSALAATLGEIISHSRFKKCERNRPRAIAHQFLLFGFVGAMITTGAIFVFIFLPHYLSLLGLESLESFFALPVNLPHPVKIIGALSGLGLVIGSGMLISRRWSSSEEVGANGYPDYLFLYIMFFTGLTGILSWLTRLTGVPMLAYSNYFLHLVCVFFLLWYMPYSKFAHMIYRTLALVYARSIGRTSP